MNDSGIRAALANPDFLKVWLTGMCVGVMRWLEVLAIGVYTLEQTGSAFTVALMYFARTAPTLVAGPLAGALGERVNRRPLYLAGLGAVFVTAAALAALSLTGHLELCHVAVGAVIAGIAWSLEHTVRRTIARDVVPPASVGNAISLDSGSQNATRMFGPLLGGLILATLGLSGAFMLGVVLYAIAIGLMLSLRTRMPPSVASTNTSPGFVQSLVDGVKYALSNRMLTAVLAVTVILNLFGFPYVSMVPVIGKETLMLDPDTLGLMAAAEGFGAVLGALLLAWRVQPRAYTRLFASGSFLFVVCIQLFSHAGGFVSASALLMVAGIGLGFFAAMQSTILLTVAAPAMRGRVMGLLVVTIGAGPFGVLALGALAEVIGAADALAMTSGVGLVLLVVAFIRWPELLRPYSPD
jgi:MFS family permease